MSKASKAKRQEKRSQERNENRQDWLKSETKKSLSAFVKQKKRANA